MQGMSTQIVDANGAIHAGDSGRFTGRVQQETDPAEVLPAPARLGPQLTAEDKVAIDRGWGALHIDEDYPPSEPQGQCAERVLGRFTGRRVAAVYERYLGNGETDDCTPTLIVFDDDGNPRDGICLEDWFCGDTDDFLSPVRMMWRPESSVLDLSQYGVVSHSVIACEDRSGGEKPCTGCGRLVTPGSTTCAACA